ncbi:MAG TPA: heme-binding protein [Opitutaceae bacterium]|nr:heme-binding protein [Opitutaceae bacterium]
MKHLIRSTLLLAILFAPVAAFSANVATKPTITLDLARKLAAKAEEEAAKNKWTVVVAIVDDGGNLVYLSKMDGTQIGSIDVAQKKARTAVKFKRPTKAFEDTVAGGRTAVLSLPDVIAIEGGVPIVVDGTYIGAIGISGAKSSEDGLVAAAALTLVSP